MTEEYIEKLAQLAEEDKNSIFVFDAFASLISGTGLDENHAEWTPLGDGVESLVRRAQSSDKGVAHCEVLHELLVGFEDEWRQASFG